MKSSDQVWLDWLGTTRGWAVRAGRRSSVSAANGAKELGTLCGSSCGSRDVLVSQVICHLATTPAWVALGQLAKLCSNLRIFRYPGGDTKRTAIETHRSTRSAFTQSMGFDGIHGQFRRWATWVVFFR